MGKGATEVKIGDERQQRSSNDNNNNNIQGKDKEPVKTNGKHYS